MEQQATLYYIEDGKIVDVVPVIEFLDEGGKIDNKEFGFLVEEVRKAAQTALHIGIGVGGGVFLYSDLGRAYVVGEVLRIVEVESGEKSPPKHKQN